MTTGIYVLYFENTFKVYVGKSRNIERRYTQHLNDLKNSSASFKLQEAYIRYGIPYLYIHLTCTEDIIDNMEAATIIEYDSISNGFNTMLYSGSYSIDRLLYRSTHPPEVYIEVLKLLINTSLSSKDISKITGASASIVRSISRGASHKWLEEVMPLEYGILLDKFINRTPGNSAKDRGIKYRDVISPDGITYSIDNITEFAKKHSLNKSNLCQLLHGVYKSHKGWKLKYDSI